MFADAEKWRKEFGVEELKHTFHFDEREEVAQYYPQYYHKADSVSPYGIQLIQYGRPLYFEQLDTIDIPALYKITTQKRLLQNLVVEYERLEHQRLPACSQKEGRLVESSFTVLDLKNVSLKQVASVYGYIQEASKIGQNYYPEKLGICFLDGSNRRPILHDQFSSRLFHGLDSHKTVLGSHHRRTYRHLGERLSSCIVGGNSRRESAKAIWRIVRVCGRMPFE
jgi:CRAL/TRIO domain